jgi:predicted metal-binding membrane protein
MPFASIPQAEPATRRDRRVLVVALAIIVAVAAGVAIWAAVRPGSYGASRDGCVTLNVPSSTGGGLLHGCGSQARTMCANAYAGTGVAPGAVRQQCRLAGISPSPAPGAGSGQ